MSKKWSKISLLFFLIVALIGTVLRSTFFVSIPLEYEHLVHAHSHVAFQGWVYTMLFLLLARFYLREEQIQKGRYPLQFGLTIAVLIGVLISFSLQGYALYSIVFSTLFQLLNYCFIYRFFKDTRDQPKDAVSLRFVKAGLWLGLLSTLLPYGIGVASAKGLAGTEVYDSLVYTFMHLQYNGWFLFVAIGLFFKLLETNAVPYHTQHATRFYWLFTLAVIPAICLSLLGMSFSGFITVPSYFAAFAQILGLVFFLTAMPSTLISWVKKKGVWFATTFAVFFLSFCLKTILQTFSVLPYFNSLAFDNKPILLAYLHLSLIGVVSFLIITLMVELKYLIQSAISQLGSLLLFLGFVSTELLLVAQGLGNANLLTLSLGSASMALGILLLLVSPSSEKLHQ